MKGILTLVVLALSFAATAPSLSAAPESTPSSKSMPPKAPPNYTLVFSDDFATDPNNNGKWTVFRRQNNINAEGYWDAPSQTWYLTTKRNDLATAAFANYELTSTVWKATFRYKVDSHPGGADGFCFMFYKDKGAYGVPDSGSYMAFQTRNPDNSKNPVPGYGVEFDTYHGTGCDPLDTDYIGIIEDETCNTQIVYQPLAIIDDNTWHAVEFRFTDGRVACFVDGKLLHGFYFPDPDYTYTGIGFGAGTRSFTSNQIIDDFQIWVLQ
jgi:hypothetical protein